MSSLFVRFFRKRVFRLAVLGGVVGLAVSSIPAKLTVARATLLFPNRLQLKSGALPDAQKETPRPDIPASALWAQDKLRSKEAVEALCKRIERTVTEDKEEVLRSACLLPEEGRLTVTPLEGNYLQLSVSAGKPEIALSLCAGLLAYLNFKAKIPLEDPEVETLVTAERQLRVQEKTLQKQLWSRLAFDAPPPDAETLQAAEMEQSDYQASLNIYRQLTREHFFRETRAAAGSPSFVVVEPPYLVYQSRSRLWAMLMGVGLGALLGTLSGRPRQEANRRFVPWRIKEAEEPKRSPLPEG